MKEIIVKKNDKTFEHDEISLENRLEIIDEGIRRKYLARLTEMEILPVGEMKALEEDLINNVRLYKINEMVYKKGEPVTDKFTTVFNTLSTYNASTFILLDANENETNFYLGVRNMEADGSPTKRSTVTLGDTLKNTLIGHFPGVKIENEDRSSIAKLSDEISTKNNVASVSVVGNSKFEKEVNNDQFVQGLEKLALAMQGRQYIGLILAQNQSPNAIQLLRKNYQDLYTKLSSLQKVEIAENTGESTTKSKSFFEMDSKQKSATIAGAAVSIAGVIGSTVANIKFDNIAAAIIGGQFASQLNGFISSLAPNDQISNNSSTTISTTTENKTITDLLALIDESLKRINEFDSYGLWNVAGYFISDDMATAEIAASNYRSLMNGENSGREVSAINSWRSNNSTLLGHFSDLTTYLSRFVHPQFIYGGNVITDATTSVSGKELGLHLGLPRTTVPGLPVIEHAEFGKEVNVYGAPNDSNPENRLTLGSVFDLGQVTNKKVELDNNSLSMHTFITGSTGSGKSNAVYQILSELRQDKKHFLVIEPSKGEYKDVFGNFDDVNVYSTNPKVSQLINLNPFKFPESIHVLEHVDGLVEIFSVCWPMYDAMPAFFKDAILKSYEEVGWDLVSSTFDGEKLEYPDFEILADELDKLIENSDYASDIKSNYRGALITRVKSLTVGLNKLIFTAEQTPYQKLFDENCILDVSRVKSGETIALIMGLTVYELNEYRVDQTERKIICKNENFWHATVLEEAHNLLKNTNTGTDSALVGKSVEMLTNTIAEIRTFGEGFVIVDQSPSSVDIAAIKNTNTKIVLRTPESNDREAVGRSMGLTEDQVNEIAKLPKGVAVVYQNEWLSPVLTKINKADVVEETFVYENPILIKPLKVARTDLIFALLQPWLPHERYSAKELRSDLQIINVNRAVKGQLIKLIDEYAFLSGKLIWRVDEIPQLQNIVRAVLEISDVDLINIASNGAESLRKLVQKRTANLSGSEINEICNVLTKVSNDDKK